MELMDMPIGVFHYLHALSLNQSRTEQGRENNENEQVMDEIENQVL